MKYAEMAWTSAASSSTRFADFRLPPHVGSLVWSGGVVLKNLCLRPIAGGESIEDVALHLRPPGYAKATTMPASAAQIAANRRNSQLSTGPKTDEGKARSRRNALKHGLTGEGVALPDEAAAEVA